MSNPKNRTLPDTITMYLLILCVYCVDIFFAKSDLGILGDAFYSRFASIVILGIYILVTKSGPSILGLSKKKEKILAGFIYGFLFSMIPIMLVLIAESVIFGTNSEGTLALSFNPPNAKYIINEAGLSIGTATLIYLATSFVSSVFKELFFRGFVLKKLKKITTFSQANLVQALLYMFMTMPLLLRNLVNGYYDKTTAQFGVFIVAFYIIHETIAGIKWGLLSRVTGASYVAIVDHFVFIFLANSFFIVKDFQKQAIQWMIHIFVLQLVSFIFVLFYYQTNMKKHRERVEREEKEEEERKKERIARRKAREEGGYVDEKLKEINEISPDQYKTIVDQSNNKHKKHRSRHSAEKIQAHNEKNSAKNAGIIDNVSTENAAEITEKYRVEQAEKSAKRHSKHRTEEQIEKHNEHIDELNEDKIDTVITSEITKIAEKFSETQVNSSHHHHSDRKAEEANSTKLDSYSADDVSKKAEEYSESLSLERKNPKHPHPHDTIARDGRLSPEQLDKANGDKVDGYAEDSIDNFLDDFNRSLAKNSSSSHGSSSHHHHSSEHKKEDEEDFDADSYIASFQKKESNRSNGSSGSHKRHRHHHRSSDDVVSIKDVSTEEFFETYQKTVDEKKKEKRQNFIKRVRELGKLDESESNDLI